MGLPGFPLPWTACYFLPLPVLPADRIELIAGIIHLVADLQQWPERSDGT